MTKLTFVPLATFAFAASIAAQSQVVASLANPVDVGVFANRQTDTAVAGPVDPGLRLSANDARSAAASSGAAPLDPVVAAGARFAWNGRVDAGSIAGTLVDAGRGLMPGAQRFELVLQSRTPVTGQLALRFNGNARNARAGATVMIGREQRSFDAASGAAGSTIDNLRVDSRGLTVMIEVEGAAGAPMGAAGLFDCSLIAAFVEGGGGGAQCTVNPGTRSCPRGGVLNGRAAVSGRAIAVGLSLAGALPGAVGFAILAPRGTTAPLGNGMCVFLDAGFLAGLFRTDRNGDGTTMLQLPVAAGTVHLQTATLSLTPRGLDVVTSNTLDVACR